MVSVSQAAAATLCIAGSALQQLALYRRDHDKDLTALSASPRLTVWFGVGLGCELLALAVLPLATLTVLGALHVFFYVLLMALEEDRLPQGAELKGAIGIAAGCL